MRAGLACLFVLLGVVAAVEACGSDETGIGGIAPVTSTTLTFPNWANAAANLTDELGRHGAVAESAYFYVVGGTRNDTDALSTVIQLLH